MEKGLSRIRTLNCGTAALFDKEKESSGTTGATRHSEAPRGLHGFFFSSLLQRQDWISVC